MGDEKNEQEKTSIMKQKKAQGALKFHLATTKDAITSRSGLSVMYETATGMGVVKNIDELIRQPGSNRGMKPTEYVMPMVLMLCGGGRTMEDIREIGMDEGLRALCGMRKVPGSDAIGQWIRKPEHLGGMKRVNRYLSKQTVKLTEEQEFTMDTDATLIETEKKCAAKTYEGYTAFSALTSYLAEIGLCVRSDYRNGNEQAGTGIEEHIEETVRLVESVGKRVKYFRSDSAGYKADVFNLCVDKKITFTITADQDVAVMGAIKAIDNGKWQPLLEEDGTKTDREYATTVHSMDKTKAAFTLIVQRWLNDQPDLLKPDKYHYYVISTDDYERISPEIIRFHNKRGNAENYHKELKNGFGMDYTPSRELAANAVYFEIGVLAYNLTIAMKRLLLAGDWIHKTIASLRWQLINIAGKVVRRGGQIFLKVRQEYFALLNSIRSRMSVKFT